MSIKYGLSFDNATTTDYISSAYVRVFDRHRQLVFEQQGYKSDWDGKYQKSKKPLPAGPYYYIVQLNDGSAARTGWLYITY